MGRFNRLFATLFLALAMMAGSMAGLSTTAVAQDEDLPTITVGSKDFTEQLVLGEMVALLLEDAGYDVQRQLNLGGTVVNHQALVNSEIDVYVEYTGTGLVAILDQDVPTTGEAGEGTPEASVAELTYDIVAETYPDEFGVTWLEPWGFNNTYALAVTAETAEEYDLQTISDLEGVSDEFVMGGTQEFLVRPDGMPGVEETYGFEFGDGLGMDPGLVYAALESGDVDIISATATDGRIPAMDLVVLEDDMGFFPPYFAAPVVRTELLEQQPEIADILNQLAGTIDDATMAELNFQVDDGGMEAIDVARTYLTEQGLIGG